jgi:NodT family efflux transporter outer membrane factor (OMF) lipoprotein
MRPAARSATYDTSGRPTRLASKGKSRRFREYRPFGLFAMAIFLAVSTGCTSWHDYVANGFKVGPNYCRPAAPVADQWIDDKDPNLSSEPANDAAWWQTFNDPILDTLIQTAYRQNLTLRAAGLRILEARAQRAIVVGELFPQTQQAFGDYTRNALSANNINNPPNRFYDEWTTGASLAWELDFWGRFRRAIEAADANLDVSVENYDDALILLVSEVAQQYIAVRTAEQRLQYARKNVEDQRISLNLAKLKFQNGATTRLDVTQGQSILDQTESLIPALEAARRQAANQICILLGMPPRNLDDMLGAAAAIPTAPPQVALGIPADLLQRRPDVRSAERQVAQQSAQIGIATSDLYPHISITGTIFFDANNFKDLFEGQSVAGSVGPAFQWNVLNYGRLVNNIRLQDARFQELVVQYQNTVLQANAEVENALIGFLKAQQSVKFLADSATAAEQSLELVRTQYDAGKTDFNRVLDIEQSLNQQQDLLAVAQGSVATNLTQVYRALGGGWQIRLAGPAGTPRQAAGETAEPVPAPSPDAKPPVAPPKTTP